MLPLPLIAVNTKSYSAVASVFIREPHDLIGTCITVCFDPHANGNLILILYSSEIWDVYALRAVELHGLANDARYIRWAPVLFTVIVVAGAVVGITIKLPISHKVCSDVRIRHICKQSNYKDQHQMNQFLTHNNPPSKKLI
ncbi:hypothetical protein ES703_48601 [subsurface metagenome]